MADARLTLPLAACALAWLTSGVAHAASHQVCLYLDIGDALWDASPRAADGEDFLEEYGRNEGPYSYPAQRWLARVHDESNTTTFFGWEPLDGSGCAVIDVPDGTASVVLEWARWAAWEITENQLVGYRCSDGDCHLDIRGAIANIDAESEVTRVVIPADASLPIDAVLWSTTFAEERFAAIGEHPLEESRIYVGYDGADVLPGKTQADRTFGNQPSVIIDGDAWHSKFTIVHELGHLETLVADNPAFDPDDLDYCYDPDDYPDAPEQCPSNHSMDGHEWQAAALIEGAAHWYAVATWNDVDLVECQGCQPGVRYVSPSAPDDAQSYIVPRDEPLCSTPGNQCPAGVGNEWDWLSAFRLFRLQAVPSFHTMFGMPSAAYTSGNWILQSPDAAFWLAFDQAMAAYLGPHHAAWLAAAGAMEIDR